jgi:hypothetical protein
MSQDFNAKLNLLIKSEKALFRLEVRRKSRQGLFVAMALLAMLAALVLFNLALYYYLGSRFDPMISAVILAGLNLFVSGIFLFIASRQQAGPEADSLQEIRDFAWEQVSSDLESARQQAAELTRSVRRVGGNINAVMHRDYSALAALLPFVQSLVASRKKSNAKKKAAEDQPD